MNNTIIITEGDPSGISPELFESSYHEIREYSKQKKIIYVTARKNYRPLSIYPISKEDVLAIPNGMYIYHSEGLTQEEENQIRPGNPSKISGKSAFLSLKKGIEMQKLAGGNLITLPLSKEWVITSGINNFSGHTEQLALDYSVDTFMMMTGKELKVITLTTHVPLLQVASKLKDFKVSSFISAIRSCKILENPKIGICGFNPHAGENGKIGNEESEILMPIIKQLRDSGFTVSDPISADSIFQKELRNKFNLILSCYHDQGLIPFKMLEGKNGVNLTLGLDFIRVSPDHGTAFEIAGKGIAENTSFLECFNYAS